MLKTKQQFTGFILGIFLFAGAILPTTVFAQDYEDSPFAIQAPYNLLGEIPQETDFLEVNSLLSDIGVKWIRMLIPELEKTEEFSHEFNIIAGISSSEYPDNMPQHIARNKEIVSLYKNDVQAWMIINEADLNWKDTEENYAKYVIEISEAIKSVSPDAKVAISFAGLEGSVHGFSAIELLDSALENGIGSHFDIIDFHFQGPKGSYKEVSDYVSEYNQILSKHGIDKKSFWITEYGTYSGDPREECSPWWVDGLQSEKEHASELIKRYIYGISSGVEKMFWTGITEWNQEYYGMGQCSDAFPYKHYFNYVGLINTPTIADNSSHKKLAYYTYKIMTERLEGSDWDNITTVIDSIDNKYSCKFINDSTGNPTYVAWWDYFNDPTYTIGDSSLITLTGISSNQVIVTDAVPNYPSGNYISNYNTAFSIDTLNVSGGSVSFYLKESPVFIEAILNNSIDETGRIIPNEFQLNQNYPNPFNPQTTISYQLPVNGDVALKIYNMLGQEVRTLINGNKPAGYHSVVWNGTDNSGRQVSSGVYFYSLKSDNNFSEINKMLLLK